MITPGVWQETTISYSDLYNAVTRRDAIYLSGEIFGMKVEMFQRPPILWEDIVSIDGITFPLPIKLSTFESDLAQKNERDRERELQKAEKERKEREKEQKAGFDEQTVAELATKEENKAYVALLIKTQTFELSYASEIKQYFPYEELQNLMQTLTIEQLEEKAKWHSKYFEKYKVYKAYR